MARSSPWTVFLYIGPFSSVSVTAVEGVLARSLIAALIALAYFAVGWTQLGASLGQRALGVQSVLWAVSVLPNAGASGLLALLYVFYLYWTTSKDPQRRGFHDQTSGTIVVRSAS